MFYSQTYLARKGPLGTVWCAAHLQHRLKKSHYTATNIPETVDLIICPEVPMALRMSSHLLLGVVRIYSKKVEYLFRDYTLLHSWLAKAFVSSQVDLPEDARQAPVESVTLPQALNLDDFNLEDDDTLEREFDNHLRSQEDITLTDQIPTGIDPYVAITFDEDIISESIPMDIDQSTEPVSGRPGETDVDMAYEPEPNNDRGDSSAGLDTGTYGPRNDTEELPEFREPGPSNMTEPLNLSPERNNANSPGSVPEIEIMRDAAHDRSPVSQPSFAAHQPNISIEQTESLDETLNEKEPSIRGIDEEVLNSRGPSTFELRSGSPGSPGSGEGRGNFGHPSPQLALQPSPPPAQPQARPRKRKHFDRVTVLTNRIMKQRLDNPSDTRRERKQMPSSKVGVWRLNNNQSKNDRSFNEPLLTGFSDALRSVFEKDCVSSKPYLAVSDETVAEPTSVSSPTREAEAESNPTSSIPQSPVPDFTNLDHTVQRSPSQQTENVPDHTVERSPIQQTENVPDLTVQLSPSQQTENIQDFEGPQSTNAESVATEAQSPQTYNYDDMGFERLRDGGYPEYMSSPTPRSSPPRTGDFTTQSGTWDTGSYRTESSTSTIPEDMPGVRNSGLSAIPEMVDEDLFFLEVGDNTPVRSPASQDSDALTGRTRALAKYLQERTSSSPSSSSASGDLSLSKILAGKTRKLAARMFYETLVLKSRGLIDMQQDKPYSDITLKLMTNLFSKV
ncbi:hypothetical protein AALP_AA6G212200 [Arabis alpina]|uniref:Rad21/Rec8-like protein N-terminal domain-containing protein n=1 Tax=Arabis alpina TaxID=50452 RepID=A0A087GQR1_ARAAL|nr:hypothetical protein AALP_AA6G212200 [Arabis alpina]